MGGLRGKRLSAFGFAQQQVIVEHYRAALSIDDLSSLFLEIDRKVWVRSANIQSKIEKNCITPVGRRSKTTAFLCAPSPSATASRNRRAKAVKLLPVSVA
jgi:hypothetical protein